MSVELVEYKSTPENYENEESGVKPNTVRLIDGPDPRVLSLQSGEAKRIRITKTTDGSWFERTITNVTFFNNHVIISWLPPWAETAKLKLLADGLENYVLGVIGRGGWTSTEFGEARDELLAEIESRAIKKIMHDNRGVLDKLAHA